jgi:HJR/Mrr/RecB family endonuclease
MNKKMSKSEKLLLEQKSNKIKLEKGLIEKERLKDELELKLNERINDEKSFAEKISEKEKELETKKEKFYKIIKFVKILIEKNKIKEEINKFKETQKGVEENIDKLKENIKIKEKEIQSLKEEIKLQEKGISFTLSQRDKGMDLFEQRWVKKSDIPKLKEARLGITNNFSNLSPYEFEHFVAKLLREMGYSTKVTQKTGDYGVDIIARKNNDTYAVQCKRFQEGNLVGNRDIQMILGARHIINANKCIFVTTSKFTKQAIQQAKGCPIELWDKEILHNFVKKYLLDLEIKEIFNLMEREEKEKLKKEKEKAKKEKEKRTCPKCGGGKMKTRKYCSKCKIEIKREKEEEDDDY